MASGELSVCFGAARSAISGAFRGVVLSPVIAKFSVFTLLQTSLHLSASAPAFYFLTDSEEDFFFWGGQSQRSDPSTWLAHFKKVGRCLHVGQRVYTVGSTGLDQKLVCRR